MGNVGMVELLLRGGAGIFTPKLRPDPLQVALFRGKTRQARQLLETCNDINKGTGFFGNALAAAIASRKLALVKLVVDAGARIDLRGRFGFPLRAAVIADQLDVVEYLLKRGADPNVKDKSLGDPLQAAASMGNLDIMLLLLVHNASVYGYCGHFGDTLQAAAFSGGEQPVRLLIEHGADVRNTLEAKRGRYGDALQAAVCAGHENIVRMLLDKGASVNPELGIQLGPIEPLSVSIPKSRVLPDPRIEQLDIPAGHGPLEMAAWQGNVALASMLLSRGARIDAADFLNRSATALQIAAFRGHHAVVEYLLEHGANVNAVRKALGTPLQAALEGGHFYIADVLLVRGAEIDIRRGRFGSCLQIFSERGDLGAVNFLLDRGADIEDPGGEYGKALQVACEAGHVAIVECLLDKGAGARGPREGCWTPLQAASANGHLNIVKLLLCHGVQVDDSNGGTETPLCAAATNGHEEVGRLLLQNGAKVDGIASLPSTESREKSGSKPRQSFPVPLHRAAYYGHESVVTMLLQNGAYVHGKGTIECPNASRHYEKHLTRYPNTPLEAACVRGLGVIVRLLFRHDPWGYIRKETFVHVLKMGSKSRKDDIPVSLVGDGVREGFKQEDIDCVFAGLCEDNCVRAMEEILRYFPTIYSPDHLIRAAISGHAAALQVLLAAGANANIQDRDGKSVLHLTLHAMEHSRDGLLLMTQPWIEVLEALVDSGADMNRLSFRMQRRFVQEVFKSGKVDLLETLDRHGCYLINEAEKYPETPTGASRKENARMVRFARKIFEAGKVNVLETLDPHGCHLFNGAVKYSETLIAASNKGQAGIVRFLCKKRAPTASENKAALAAAMESMETQPEIINTLLFSGAPLSFDEDALLTTASKTGSTEIVAAILRHATHSTRAVEQAVEAAVRDRNVASTRTILESQAGERMDRRTICTRLAQICPQFHSADVLSYLLSQGVDPDVRDPKSGDTLLYKATLRGANDTVKPLLSHNANPCLEAGKHGTALYLAGVIGSVDAIELFLSLGVDINKRSGRFGTLLAAVMAQKWVECARCFEAHTCQSWSPKEVSARQMDINHVVEKYGGYPVGECHRCCARLLLHWDADIDTISGESGTALQVANNVGNIEGVEMMLCKRDMDSNMTRECVSSSDISDSE